VRIDIKDGDKVKIYLWFHASFVASSPAVFPRAELDGKPAKKKHKAKFSDKLAIELAFTSDAVPVPTKHAHKDDSVNKKKTKKK